MSFTAEAFCSKDGHVRVPGHSELKLSTMCLVIIPTRFTMTCAVLRMIRPSRITGMSLACCKWHAQHEDT